MGLPDNFSKPIFYVIVKYQNIESRTITTSNAGSMFIILSFLISRILIPNPIKRIPPVEVSPAIISDVKKWDALMANKVIPPWKISNGTDEKTTPKPNAEASRSAENPSISDFVNNTSEERSNLH